MDKKKKNNGNPVRMFTKKGKNKGDTHSVKGKGKFKKMKPVILATISAIVIGSVLGVVMLNIFTNTKNDMSHDEKVLSSAVVDEDSNDEATQNSETQVNSVTLDQLSAQVIQAGVFSEKENAEEWSKTYDDNGFSTVIWERDSQFFLLAGIANESIRAEQLATKFTDSGHDVFVKEWTTGEVEVELTKEEQDWIEAFEAQWNKTLQSIDGQTDLFGDGWVSLTTTYPENTEVLLDLIDTIHMLQEEHTGQVSESNAQNILLNIWLNYEKTFH